MQKSVSSMLGGMNCIPGPSTTCIGDGNHMWEMAIKGFAQKVVQVQCGQKGNEVNLIDAEDWEE